ncbi:hypothetical protein B0H14DRAFT_1346228 [Mycena olivaceomarginata]|nr:hypothetical protein B0H14DRAFT_1346228 [Mycena olivaceomarginata]
MATIRPLAVDAAQTQFASPTVLQLFSLAPPHTLTPTHPRPCPSALTVGQLTSSITSGGPGVECAPHRLSCVLRPSPRLGFSSSSPPRLPSSKPPSLLQKPVTPLSRSSSWDDASRMPGSCTSTSLSPSFVTCRLSYTTPRHALPLAPCPRPHLLASPSASPLNRPLCALSSRPIKHGPPSPRGPRQLLPPAPLGLHTLRVPLPKHPPPLPAPLCHPPVLPLPLSAPQFRDLHHLPQPSPTVPSRLLGAKQMRAQASLGCRGSPCQEHCGLVSISIHLCFRWLKHLV